MASITVTKSNGELSRDGKKIAINLGNASFQTCALVAIYHSYELVGEDGWIVVKDETSTEFSADTIDPTTIYFHSEGGLITEKYSEETTPKFQTILEDIDARSHRTAQTTDYLTVKDCSLIAIPGKLIRSRTKSYYNHLIDNYGNEMSWAFFEIFDVPRYSIVNLADEKPSPSHVIRLSSVRCIEDLAEFNGDEEIVLLANVIMSFVKTGCSSSIVRSRDAAGIWGGILEMIYPLVLREGLTTIILDGDPTTDVVATMLFLRKVFHRIEFVATTESLRRILEAETHIPVRLLSEEEDDAVVITTNYHGNDFEAAFLNFLEAPAIIAWVPAGRKTAIVDNYSNIYKFVVRDAGAKSPFIVTAVLRELVEQSKKRSTLEVKCETREEWDKLTKELHETIGSLNKQFPELKLPNFSNIHDCVDRYDRHISKTHPARLLVDRLVAIKSAAVSYEDKN